MKDALTKAADLWLLHRDWDRKVKSRISAQEALIDETATISLEDAGLEEDASNPLFGFDDNAGNGVVQLVGWWSDEEDSRWENN